ncbi:hypothetical protein ISF_08643 [Cordyceps fumosorosea ARSEF 2679]|uniref:Uncharacterized protein n=1 Tax=Cordyceps fumosorosea (strain ARSEF 2679) TaxID=1081104 RepID=A0A167LYW9_CORFA|nr:hypothetical protein ISF_08643 [Cordyceps fumosorosea ARSEF 2679]OAA53704.1 hypothetical protein ISF_08643 [Cordyceps fumosorosea ARSEF 2679]
MSTHAPLATCQALARALGWATSLGAMVVMGFIANRWPDKIGSVVGGMVGVAVALLNDSWQMTASIPSHALAFHPPFPASRALLHDMVSMALCMAGLVLIIFTGTSTTPPSPDSAAFTLCSLVTAAHWFLVGVILWRFVFAVWGCYDCVRLATPERQRLRYRRQMEEAQMYDA